MPNKKFQQVRQLTIQIAEFVEALNIKGCNELIQQRLVLLQEIKLELAQLNSDSSITDQLHTDFQTLLTWLADYDAKSHSKTEELKQQYKEKLSKQKKTNFAIKQYTSL